MATEDGNNKDNSRQSNRVRNPPNSAFAKDFVGESWEKLQIRSDLEGVTSIDMNGINPRGRYQFNS